MARKIFISIIAAFTIISCGNSKTDKKMVSENDTVSECSDTCKHGNDTSVMACKMTTVELRKRKETVLASLKSQIVEKKELGDGYAFKFSGTDKMLDELIEFIKTERECCDFFTFSLSVSGDKSEVWLELTGAEGAKEFISSELGL